MHDSNHLIDRIVYDARLPSTRRRRDLRQELTDHFADAAADGVSAEQAIARFGSDRSVVAAFRGVYRAEYAVWTVLRLAAGAGLAAVAGLLLVSLSGVRFDGNGLQTEPWFIHRALNVVKLSIAAVIGWELSRRKVTLTRVVAGVAIYAVLAGALQLTQYGTLRNWHFWNVPIMAALGIACIRIERRFLGLALTFAGYVLTIQVFLLMRDRQIVTSIVAGPDRLLLTALECFVAWITLLAVMPRFDHTLSPGRDRL